MNTALSFLLVLLLHSPALTQDLPPEVLADQYLLEASKALATLATLWVVGKIGQIPAVISVPSDAVVAFNANACPHGWRE